MATIHSASDRCGVDVCLSVENEVDVPQCPHGPMLLFERFFKDGKSAKFFACSACRDKKQCPFFQWEHEKISPAREQAHDEIIKRSKPSSSQLHYSEELDKILKAESKNSDILWRFCHDCNILEWDNKNKHKDHSTHSSEDVHELRHPSTILKPLDNVKAQAQFLFSKKSTTFLVSLIRKLGYQKVLCLGTPRIHEQIQINKLKKGKHKPMMDSLLLDIDYRYGQFFPSNCFIYYNMFNHHFFEEKAKNVLSEFLQSSESNNDIVLIMDPPFGGLVEVLANTVKKLWQLWRECSVIKDNGKEMPTLWIFPYFMESHIQESLPSLKMMDYKVDYDNHPHFKGKQDNGSKRGSPVRMFTNIDPASIKLPAEEGYRFCKICKRFVSAENSHCAKCNSCTSKDGRQYVHCDQCEKCVKPGRSHCNECNHCDLPNHVCQRSSVKGCHICGELGHKRKNCPTRTKDTKRKSTNDTTAKGSRKRKSKDLKSNGKKKRK